MSKIYSGLPYRSLFNPHLQLDFLTTAGPRLVGLYFSGRPQNLLVELPDLVEKTPFGDFRFLGGHRLWHAPEALPRTYIPDNEGAMVGEVPNGIRIEMLAEAWTHIAKSIGITLNPDRPQITVRHELRNEGVWPLEFSAWGITILRLGGVAIFPQPGEMWMRPDYSPIVN